MPRFAQGHAETEKGSAQVRPGSPLRQPAANPAADQSVARGRTSKELRQPDIREDFTRIPTYSGSDETPPVAAVFSSAVAPPVGTVQRKCDACREVDENIRPFKDTHARQAHPIGDKMRPPSCSAGSKVSAAGDSYEQEADRTADQVMSTRAHPSPGSVPVGVQRAAGQPGEHLEAAPASVSSAVAKPRAPLEPALRHDMELRFGRDFSRVRVHTDAAAEQSSRDVKAHAYTTGHDIVFGANQFAPETQPGRRLIAHELTHVVQQRGENHLVQRAPANYPSNAPVPAPVAPKEKAVPQLSTDDWIWLLETLRRDSPQEFLKILAANEAYFYPILSPHGFRGSWEKEQDYLTDFDAAVLKWGKSHTYSVMYPHISRPIARQRPKSREEQKYEYANYLVRDMNRHGYGRGKVNSELESAGLMDDLEAHGFEKHDRWSFKNHVEYRNEAIVALNAYIDRYDAAHGNLRQTSANVPTQGEDVEFYRAWLEGLGYVTSSFFAAAFANAASKFTSDPKKITAAAGLGVAVEGVVFSMGAALGAGGTYRPNVVGPQDRPTAVGSWRYSGKQPIKPIVDPWKVGTPTPDVKPAGKTTASEAATPSTDSTQSAQVRAITARKRPTLDHPGPKTHASAGREPMGAIQCDSEEGRIRWTGRNGNRRCAGEDKAKRRTDPGWAQEWEVRNFP
jgi:hypothetical protein